MYIYKNGDICPCCGNEIKDMTGRELELFSQLLNSCRIEPLPEIELEPVDFQRPPDAGLNPPVNPKF